MIFARVVANLFAATVLLTAGAAQDLRTMAPTPLPTQPGFTEVINPNSWREYFAKFPSALITGYEENDSVPISLFTPKGAGPFPTVLILHYWGASDLRIERSLAGRLTEKGIAACIMRLPYHLERAPEGTRSGELAVRPDPELLRITMVQAVLDARRTLDILSTRPDIDFKRFAVAGISLGSLVAATTFAIDDRFQAGAFMLGGADFADIVWNSSRVVSQREELRRKGFTEETLREELKGVEPLTYLPGARIRPTFVVNARFDTVMPPESSGKLIEALHTTNAIWLDSGHFGGVLVQDKLFSEATQFFATTLNGGTYTAPKHVFVPTIRLGAQLTFDKGFDVGVGVDLLPPRKEADRFISLFLTPRSPELFFGHGLDRTISIGIGVAPRRVFIGALWSIVL